MQMVSMGQPARSMANSAPHAQTEVCLGGSRGRRFSTRLMRLTHGRTALASLTLRGEPHLECHSSLGWATRRLQCLASMFNTIYAAARNSELVPPSSHTSVPVRRCHLPRVPVLRV